MSALALAATIAAWGVPASAAGVSVLDGSLADWGIDVKDGSGGGAAEIHGGTSIIFNKAAGVGAGTNYFSGLRPNTNGFVFQKEDGIEGTGLNQGGAPVAGSRREDIYDQADHSTMVDPNRGGQDYDAEWMGTALAGNTLYLAILSGVRPDNGFNSYGPGDVRIVAKDAQGNVLREYGVEVGGYVGGNSGANGAIGKGGSGATYVLSSGGFTEKVLVASDGNSSSIGATTSEKKFWNSTDSGSFSSCPTQYSSGGISYGINEGQEAGTVWRMDNASGPGDFWIRDPLVGTVQPGAISPGGNLPAQIGCGATKVGEVDEYNFTRSSVTNTHSIMEMSFNLAMFGDFAELDIYWGPSCGNDVLKIEWPRDPAEVPAPGGLLLLASGLFGLAYLRRRRAR